MAVRTYKEAVAVANSNKNGKKVPDTQLLKLYSYFKQVESGPCKDPKPGMFDLRGKAKWEAWNSLGAMSKVDAEAKYIALVNELFA